MLEKFSRLVRAKKFRTLLFSAAIACCGFANTASAIPFSDISEVFFFGDSLSDSGFNDLWPGLPAGKAPTFTTYGGYIWSQFVAHDVIGFPLPTYPGPNTPDRITNNTIYPVPGFVSATLNGINYAAAGSTTNSTGNGETWAPSLIQQVELYEAKAGQKADGRAVYFIWEGANDFLTLLSGATPPTQLQLLLAANLAANNIAAEASRLAASGANRIVVMALPNLGATPLITGTAISTGNPTLPATMKTLTFSFNSMLNTALGGVTAKYGTKILLIDIYDLFGQIIADTNSGTPYVISGQSFNFINATMPACATVQQAIMCPPGTPNGYVFADVLHPTGMAHKVISLYVENAIETWA
jgi:outer membrane lipase/esterase